MRRGHGSQLQCRELVAVSPEGHLPMHSYDLILTITGGLSAALVLGYLTHRLGLSPIVGYLLAGTLVGPHTPGFVADVTLAEQLAEIGVILLMFRRGPAIPRRGTARGPARCRARCHRSKRGRHAAGGTDRAHSSDGTGRRVSSSAWHWPSPAPSFWSGCSPTTTICIRPPVTSLSGGWSSRTCSRCSRWCCCRRCSIRRRTARRCGWPWRRRRSRSRRS